LLPSMASTDGSIQSPGPQTSFLVIEDDDLTKGIGILFFRRWEEDREGFSQEVLAYFAQLDEGGFIDYGMILKSDVTDPDEISRLRKISNYGQAVNNSLFDIPIPPPYYYLAVPLSNREHGQQICDMIKEAYDIDSLFFTYPSI